MHWKVSIKLGYHMTYLLPKVSNKFIVDIIDIDNITLIFYTSRK